MLAVGAPEDRGRIVFERKAVAVAQSRGQVQVDEIGRSRARSQRRIAVFGVAACADADLVARRDRDGARHQERRRARHRRCQEHDGRRHGRLEKEIALGIGRCACIQDARDIDALAAVREEAVDGVGQIAVIPEAVIQVLAEPALELARAGDEDGDVDRTALRQADHAGGAGGHAFDRFGPRIDFFDVDGGCQIFGHGALLWASS